MTGRDSVVELNRELENGKGLAARAVKRLRLRSDEVGGARDFFLRSPERAINKFFNALYATPSPVREGMFVAFVLNRKLT